MFQHSEVIGLFAGDMTDILTTQERLSTFYAPGVLHHALMNLAFASSGETEKEFLHILHLEDRLRNRTVCLLFLWYSFSVSR